jgi:pimeloyl-ACP methyl ester carboxylesterase
LIMTKFIPWNSQPLNEWSRKYAPGKFVDLDGYATHYIEMGSGEPVILLHGYFYDSLQWSKNLGALAARFKVYALDLWGFGYSTREPMDYGYPLYVRQLLKFLDVLGIEKASLVGQSMGGGTAILFATQRLERVNKLVLVASGGLPNPQSPVMRIAGLPGIGEFLFGLKGSRRGILKANFIYDENKLTDEYVEAVTRFQKVKGTTEVMLKVLRKRFWDTLSKEIHTLGKMSLPVLIVWGRQDKSIPVKLARDMHHILKGSRLEIIDQAGHCPNDEQPEVFNRLALEFLSSKPKS